ncbi:MAG: hypothetical protein M1837_002616 [Sclerophora amabilis]|nr:MAG: hypothetical protein M1837_002616 [Sclerophora amabilis]
MADPLSAAGLGLGAASLAYQIFAGCIKGYQLLGEAMDMPAENKHLRTRLQIEQHRLLNWSQVAGLADEQGPRLSTSLQLNRTLLIDILLEIRNLLDNFGKLNGRYDALLPVNDSGGSMRVEVGGECESHQTSKTPSEGSKSSRFPRGTNKIMKLALDTIDNAPSAPKRLRWATFDKEKLTTLLMRLGELNDFMQSLMDENQSKALLQTQHQTYMEILQLHNSVHDLKQLVRALSVSDVNTNQQATNEVSRSPSSVDIMTMQRKEKQSLADLARFKEFNADIENSTERTNTELKRSSFSFDMEQENGTTDRRVDAVFQSPSGVSKHVWVEWKAYVPRPWALDSKPEPNIVDRVQQLTALLRSTHKPEAFRVPRCLGYFDDRFSEGRTPECRFGFVFEKPVGIDPQTQPVSLLELVTTRDKPSLTDRIALATRIANCILYLHSVNWLHKGLRSHNIVFFFGTGDPDYHQPYLSGFDYARPARPEEMTEKPPQNAKFDVYRHPFAHGDGPNETTGTHNPFKKSYDIYSLGIILVEIAVWRPIDKITGISNLTEARPSDTREIQAILLKEEKYLNRIGADVGDVYRDVVKACLQGAPGFGIAESAKETREEVAAELQQRFTEQVVDRLAGMSL